MSKDQLSKLPQYPGPEALATSPTSRRQMIGGTELQDRGFPANLVADEFESINMGRITTSGGPLATASNFTFTVDSTGAVANGVDGYTVTTAAVSGNKMVIRHNRRASTSGALAKVCVAKYRIAIDTVATSTMVHGFYNSSTDPVGTAPTNGVFFVITNGAIVGRVRGNSGAAASTGTLVTMTDATFAELDIKFLNTGDVTTSWIEFWVNGVVTAGTSAQLAQLIAMTGNLFHHVHVQPTGAGAKVLTVDYCYPTCDR